MVASRATQGDKSPVPKDDGKMFGCVWRKKNRAWIATFSSKKRRKKQKTGRGGGGGGGGGQMPICSKPRLLERSSLNLGTQPDERTLDPRCTRGTSKAAVDKQRRFEEASTSRPCSGECFFLPPLDLHLPPRIPKREGQSGRQDLQFQAPLVNLRRSKPLFFPSFAEYTRARVAPFVFACSPLSFPRRVLRRGGSTIVFLVGAGWSASEHGAHADSRPGSVAPFPGGGKAVRSSKTSALFGFLSRGATCTAATISSFPRKASSQLCFFALLLKTLTTQSLSLSLELPRFQPLLVSPRRATLLYSTHAERTTKNERTRRQFGRFNALGDASAAHNELKVQRT